MDGTLARVTHLTLRVVATYGHRGRKKLNS